MTESLTATAPGRLVFDEDGDVDPQTMADLMDALHGNTVADLVLFSHGWNNDEAAATSLYQRWFGLLAAELDPGRNVGYVGIRWPAQLWRDEPIPDFAPASAHDHLHGAAALEHTAVTVAGSPTIDAAELDDLKGMFPGGSAQLQAIAELLEQPPTAQRVADMFATMREFAAATHTGFSDGEVDDTEDGNAEESTEPGMLDPQRDPVDVFTNFADRLAEAGVEFDDGGGGAAGLGDFAAKLWHGAKQALRQLTYWQMKNRAGVVGQNGLGPAIDKLAEAFPDMRIHLIGHSFGARVVSYALSGMSQSTPSPVKSVTLLQAAYSRFAFADSLPFRTGAGALAGKLNRIDGPLTVCFSSHDRALGMFYPIASAGVGDDAAAAEDPLARWRAMGSLGAFRAESQALGPVGAQYPFKPGQILNLDASDVVVKDAGLSGAHSDIFHSELAWVAATASGLGSR